MKRVPASAPRRLAGLLSLLVVAAPLPAAAQAPVVRSARLMAEVSAGGTDAEVRIEYTVAGGRQDAAPVRVELLGFGPAAVDSVRVEGQGRAIRLAPEAGSMRAGTFSLPPARTDAEEVGVSLAYRVAGAVERSGPHVRVRVPVLVLDLPPAPGGGPVFHGSVRLPDTWSVSGAFPTGLAAGGEGSWEMDLSVVPALVSLRGRSDGAWRPGLPQALDALALVLLLGFGLVGWRHLRELGRARGSASPGTESLPHGSHPSGASEPRP